MKVTVDGQAVEVEVRGAEVRVTRGGRTRVFTCARRPDGRVDVVGEGAPAAPVWVRSAHVGSQGHAVHVEKVRRNGAAPRTAVPMAGTVTAVHVEAGDVVEAGAPLFTVSAMKTEVVVRAAAAGIVATVGLAVGRFVRPDEDLVVVAPPR